MTTRTTDSAAVEAARQIIERLINDAARHDTELELSGRQAAYLTGVVDALALTSDRRKSMRD